MKKKKNIETCSRTLKHWTYNVGFYDKKIDSVQLSVLDTICSLFGKKGKIGYSNN